jgi:Ca2+-binding RTX toxin-like protein
MRDLLRGGRGRDGLWGQEKADCLFGQAGQDVVHGGNGDDRVKGGDQLDNLKGDEGDDILRGGRGRLDFLAGGAGDDFIFGGPGTDRIWAGAGSDRIVDVTGRNEIDCGRDADEVVTNTESQVANDCEDVRRLAILLSGCSGPEPYGGDFDVVGLRPNALYFFRYLSGGGHYFTTNDAGDHPDAGGVSSNQPIEITVQVLNTHRIGYCFSGTSRSTIPARPSKPPGFRSSADYCFDEAGVRRWLGDC